MKDFQYYLYKTILGVNHYYYLDSNGDVQTTTTKRAIQFAPKGWREQGLKWDRGFVYHGIIQTYTEPLKFVKDGAKILRYLYVNYGTEPECNLLIEKYNRTLAVRAYEPYFLGEIDFSRYNREKDFVNTEIMEGGFMAKLKAKENTSIEIPVLDNPNRVWVNMDGLLVLGLFRFTGMEQPIDNSPPTFMGSSRENFPTLLYFQTEGYSNGDNNPKGNDYVGPNAQMFQQNYAGVADMITLSSADKWFIRNVSGSISYDYNIKGSMTIDHQNMTVSAKKMTLYIYKNLGSALGTAVTKYTVIVGGNIPGLGTLTETLDFDFNITLAPDEQIWLWFRHSGLAGDVKYHLKKMDVNVSIPNRVKQSYIPALRNFDVGKAIFADIDPTTTFVSPLLETTHITKVLTCGDALRGLLKAVMKTNIADYYKSNNALFNTCMVHDKIGSTININEKAFAFDEATQILDLGRVSKFKHYPLTAEMFAKYIIGYRDVKYDEVNGKDEFNLTQEYQSPLVRITNEKDIRSDYRADMYGIELTRGNLEGKVLADSDSDNDIFWIDIEDTPAGVIPAGLTGAGEDYYNLNRSGYTVTQGLFSASTAFNLYLSPKLMARTHGNYINSVLYPQVNLPGSRLTFKTASKNQDDATYLIWDIAGDIVDERADILLANLDNPLFYGIVFEFECLVPQNILSVLSTNPFGKIKFTADGLDWYGFLLEVSDEPVLKPKQTYKLLCSTSNDLNKLI